MSLEIKAVIFDVDGLLLDTESLYLQVDQSLVNDYSKEPRKITSRERKLYVGTTQQHSMKVIIEEFGLPLTIEEAIEIRAERLQKVFPTCKEMPGARKLVEHLFKNKIPIATATSSSRRDMEIKLQNHQWIYDSMGKNMVCGDDITNHKPNPEIFLLAASKLNIDPQYCLVFEDSINGIKAGINAGMNTIHVPSGEDQRDTSLKSSEMIDSIEDFVPEKYTLLPYEKNLN
ncbi:2-deoxyglucose-6-phosphate phosphatase 2 [Anaeramoeba flamelloides]|uniref:2-deoxyglucose-6-phosphate phosphatase 2 n=1 Tax=Anaeramoeba flamelloides TaxID=1746091 RepID=A0ABQ8YSE0_9EUKA|nr:2-deoxyglucose-6-phosphate phosphatase 2 [Anaeramoeba flamelloides]